MQGAEIAGRLHGNCFASDRHDIEATSKYPDPVGRSLCRQSLQHITQHEIPNDDLIRAKNRAQAPGMAGYATNHIR